MKHTRRYLVAGLVALTVVGLVVPRSGVDRSRSSFGSIPEGYRALYVLLDELGLCAGRSLEPVARLPERATVWWIDPEGVCDARIAFAGGVDVLDPQAVSWPARGWVEAGGTAVVFLGGDEPGRVPCDAIAGIELPGRRPSTPAPKVESVGGEKGAGGDGGQGARLERAVVSGPLTSAPRRLGRAEIFTFQEALDWSVAASVSGLSSDRDAAREGGAGAHEEQREKKEERSARHPLPESGARDPSHAPSGAARPFVLERALGAGRLVVVADSGFTRNESLDSEDAAPLAVDLVRRYGAPFFDEREHGFLSETNAVRYLAGSPAWPVFAGLILLGALFAWWGTALPARSVDEFDPETPTLTTFVDSMAVLYARSRDHSRLFERYRELTAARLRRHFGLSSEVSVDALAERIERDGRGAAGGLRILTESRRVAGEQELAGAARELDTLVREVTR